MQSFMNRFMCAKSVILKVICYIPPSSVYRTLFTAHLWQFGLDEWSLGSTLNARRNYRAAAQCVRLSTGWASSGQVRPGKFITAPWLCTSVRFQSSKSNYSLVLGQQDVVWAQAVPDAERQAAPRLKPLRTSLVTAGRENYCETSGTTKFGRRLRIVSVLKDYTKYTKKCHA